MFHACLQNLFQTVPLSYWINPAERLVQTALNKWRMRLMKADNTSAIVVLIDPLGPRKLSILRKKREERMKEIAEKRLNCNKSVSELLTAKESLQKSIQKKSPEHHNVISVNVCANGKSPCHGSQNAQHSPANTSLDDSIQLRNGHVLSPVSGCKSHENKLVKSAPAVKVPENNHHNVQSCSKGGIPAGQSRMATRLSPHKSPLGQSLYSQNSPIVQANNSVAAAEKANGECARSNKLTTLNPNQPKCLQPSKGTAENVKSALPHKLTNANGVTKMKDVENLYSSVIHFGKGQLNIKSNQPKCNSDQKNLNNSSHSADGLRSTKKAHTTKSLSTRISLRLRRIRQKTQLKGHKGQAENKGFSSSKTGVKRKLDQMQCVGTPVSKKVKHS